jgi:5-methylcytosine-specific restriction endonuclease McrA
MGRWRSPAHRAQYGGDYTRKRAHLLQGAPLCHACGQKPATTLDHIIPLKYGGTNDWDNLRPLCGACNSSLGGRIATHSKARRHDALPRASRSSFDV